MKHMPDTAQAAKIGKVIDLEKNQILLFVLKDYNNKMIPNGLLLYL